MARSWYAYNGVGDPVTLSSYNFAFSKPACISGGRLCAIYATGTGVNPSVISANLRGYIADVQLTLVARPDGSAAIKKYAYGKA
ncbi:hypothetical protein [Pedobacter cryoconitis]|uniref:Uncharacterized protein n=1 Tax=Pedobacter cryoconitis TaxID=188932 RepID=A0A327T510_9SPHI|nr:hypothetical protein [Pedobacter cryoconitis]RAJ35445.1 hypothetical protein LY11_00688 [Pedobacter cryoconitis]